MVNWDRINELRGEVGEDAFTEVIALFMEEVEDVLNRVGTLPEVSYDDRHFLKGCALNLGFAELAHACDDGASGRRLTDRYEASKRAFLAGLEPV